MDDPNFLCNALEVAMGMSDIWWSRQFFWKLIKLKQSNLFKDRFPIMVARVCYYKFYNSVYQVISSDDPRVWWSAIEEIIKSYKALDAWALIYSYYIAARSDSNWRINPLIEDFSSYLHLNPGPLPETHDLMPAVSSLPEYGNFRAVEYLFQHRKVPLIQDLPLSDLKPDIKTDLKIEYCGFNETMAQDIDSILEPPRLIPLLNNTLLFNLFYVYDKYQINISIDPEPGDVVWHTNCFIFHHLKEEVAKVYGLSVDNLKELCYLDLKCDILRGSNAISLHD
jgi:hypothetical protein